MAERPIRWLVDDARKFAAREVRRGQRYDGIILDPPKFGRGPEGEVWRLEEGLPPLIADCRRLLDADSRFLFLTVYAVRMSSLALAGCWPSIFADLPGTIEHGDLAVREEGEGAPAADRDLRTLAQPLTRYGDGAVAGERRRARNQPRPIMPSSRGRLGRARSSNSSSKSRALVPGDGDHADVEIGLLAQGLLAVLRAAHEQQRVATGRIESGENQRVGHLAHLVGVGLRQPKHDDAGLAQPREVFRQAGRGWTNGCPVAKRRRPVVEIDDHGRLMLLTRLATLGHVRGAFGREQRRIGLLRVRRAASSAYETNESQGSPPCPRPRVVEAR
jgi:hypothetical protein